MAQIAVRITKSSKPRKALAHIEIHPADGGGHIVEHHFEHRGFGEVHEPEKHVFGKEQSDDMLDHVSSTLGLDKEDGKEDEE